MCKKNFFLKLTFIFLISIVGCNNNDDADKGGFFEKGVALFERGEFKKAKLEIKNAIKKNPGIAEPYYYLALLDEKERKFKAMKSNLIKAIELDPEHTKARLKLSKIYLLFNELDEALEEVNYVLIGCGLRLMSVSNDTEQQKRILEFQKEFVSQNKECTTLIVHSTIAPDEWTIAGFNDEGIFKRALINDPGSELSVELKKEPANKSKIIELAASKLGRTILIKEPDQLDALSINASILIRQEKTKEALAIIDSVLQKDANHIDALSLKIVLLMKEEAFDEALAILSPAIQNDGKNITLYLLKTQLDTKRDDTNALIDDYEKLVEFKPDDIYIKYALAKVYLKSNQRQKAEEILRKLVHDNSELIDAKLALLDFLYTTDVNKAEKQLNIFIEEYNNKHTVLIKFSNWLIGKGRADRAVEILNTVVIKDDISKQDKAKINLILSKIEISNKRFENGLTYIEKILKEDSSNFDAKLLKAEVLFANENYGVASKLLEEILWQKPDMDLALSLFGRIDLILGDWDKADANFKEALKINPANLVALKFIVSKAISENHVDYGIEILERALRFSPAKVTLLIKLIELNIDEQNWDIANKYIDIIKQQKNGGLYAQYFKARVLQKQNKNKQAIVIYKEILENYPGLKDALVGMAESYSALNQQSQMKQYLDGVIQNNPNIIFPYILKSQLLSLEKQNSEAIKLLNSALKTQEIKHPSLYIELARQHTVLGEKDAEYQTYIEALNYNSEDIKLLLLLASFHEKKKEFDKAVEQYDKVLLINPRQNIAKNNLATILIDHYGKPEDIDKAVQLTITFKQSKQPYFLDTYAWAQLKNGRINKALPIFKKVALLAPDVPVFRYHLAVAYNSLGDTMSAVSELKQALYLGKEKVTPEKVLIEELLAEIKSN